MRRKREGKGGGKGEMCIAESVVLEVIETSVVAWSGST